MSEPFFEMRTRELNKENIRLRKQLTEAHALIGRVIHQLSKRWDVAPISPFMSGLLD